MSIRTEIMDFQQEISSRAYFTAASLGIIPGVSVEVKFGHCPDATAVATDVWEYGATQPVYIFPASGGEALEVVSDSGADAQEIKVFGLDTAGLVKIETVNLTGVTPVPLPGLWTAVNRAYNSDATNVAGTITVRGDGSTSVNVFALICVECQQTSQAIYTVPSNKVAVLNNLSTAVNKPLGVTVSTIFNAQVASPGKVFRTQIRYGLQESGTSNISSNLIIPEILGPGYRAKIRGLPSVGPSDLSAEFSMLLIDKELVPRTVLAALEA